MKTRRESERHCECATRGPANNSHSIAIDFHARKIQLHGRKLLSDVSECIMNMYRGPFKKGDLWAESILEAHRQEASRLKKSDLLLINIFPRVQAVTAAVNK